MGNWIMAKGKDILKLSNVTFERLHEEIDQLAQSKNLNDPILLNLIDRMDQNTYGGGMILLDLDDYFKNSPESLLTFINLIKEANNKLIQSSHRIGLPETMAIFISELEEYHKKLISKNQHGYFSYDRKIL